MMKAFFIIIASLVLATSCGDKQGGTPDWPWQDPESETAKPDVPQQPEEDATLDKWTDVSSGYSSLPEYI